MTGEEPTTGVLANVRPRASMRPRLGDRGRDLATGRVYGADEVASMRPRLGDRGRVHAPPPAHGGGAPRFNEAPAW